MQNKWIWTIRINTGKENQEETGFCKTAGEAYLEASRKVSLWLDSPENSYNAINIHISKRWIKDYVIK